MYWDCWGSRVGGKVAQDIECEYRTCIENQMCLKSHGGNLRYNFSCVPFAIQPKEKGKKLENNC